MRQIVLDTETTGLEPGDGHRIIEIGCLEILDRRITRNSFHTYLNPERQVDAGALEVHGIDNRFLKDKRKFAEVADEFLKFVTGAELVIHNAAFDVGFINHELKAHAESGVRRGFDMFGARHVGDGASPASGPEEQPGCPVQTL